MLFLCVFLNQRRKTPKAYGFIDDFLFVVGLYIVNYLICSFEELADNVILWWNKIWTKEGKIPTRRHQWQQLEPLGEVNWVKQIHMCVFYLHMYMWKIWGSANRMLNISTLKVEGKYYLCGIYRQTFAGVFLSIIFGTRKSEKGGW